MGGSIFIGDMGQLYTGANRVNRVLEELPQIYKEVMHLYVVCENNVDEVAKALDLTKQTVYKRIQRARKMIEKALEE